MWQYGIMKNYSMLNFGERKINEVPNIMLNMVHVSSLNSMILKPEDVTGKKILQTNVSALKGVLQNDTKPREHPWRRALAGLS